MIHRTAFFIDNLLLTTDYDSIITSTLFFDYIDPVARKFNVTNCNFQVSGYIMSPDDPSQAYFGNIKIDYYKSKRGVWSASIYGDEAELEK